MKKLGKLFLCLAATLLILASFAACGTTYDVTFRVSEDESYTVSVVKNGKVRAPYVDCETGTYVEGWYNNP